MRLKLILILLNSKAMFLQMFNKYAETLFAALVTQFGLECLVLS